MPAINALSGAPRRPVTYGGNRHIVTAILVVLYVLLLIAGLGLAIVQPRPPLAPNSSPPTAPSESASYPRSLAGQAANLLPRDTFRIRK